MRRSGQRSCTASSATQRPGAVEKDAIHVAAGSTRRDVLSAGAAAGAALLLPPLVAQPARAQPHSDGAESWRKLEDRVSEFTLPNGLHFIVLERHTAPVLACHTYANVGAFDEEEGKTGLAHLLEHMAFKGTARIGTTNARREAKLLDALDEVFYEQQEATAVGDMQEVSALSRKLLQLQSEAETVAVPNAFGSLIQRAGAVGLNAGTSHDATKYYVSLPANKLELWFAMEAERFQAPMFRQLYAEKRVVAEERRLRVDDSPMGAFQEAFAAQAFANNYRRPVIGWPSDFDSLGRREVAEFYRRNYGPSALTIAIVGDAKPEQVRQYAEKYFGSWRDARGATPPTLADGAQPSAAPDADSSREFEQKSLAGPAVLHAFYRPGAGGADNLELDVVSALLSGSRTSRLYRSLVQPGRATSANSIASFPGDKHPGVMLLYANARPGGSLESLSSDVLKQAHELASSIAPAAELERVKKGFRVNLLEALASNSSMAATLASYSALTGDWRRVLSDLDAVDGLSGEAVRQAAEKTFADGNMFTGRVLPLRQPRFSMELSLPADVP